MFKMLAKLFIMIAAMAFAFFLLMRFAPSTNAAVFSGHALLWWHVIVGAVGLLAYKMVR